MHRVWKVLRKHHHVVFTEQLDVRMDFPMCVCQSLHISFSIQNMETYKFFNFVGERIFAGTTYLSICIY